MVAARVFAAHLALSCLFDLPQRQIDATWNVKGLKAASDRFNYDYSEQELGEIAA